MTVIVPQALGTVDVEITDEGTKVIELHHIPIEVHMLRLQYIGGPMVELAIGNDRTLYRVSVPLQSFAIVADPVSVKEYVKTHPTKRGLDPDEITLCRRARTHGQLHERWPHDLWHAHHPEDRGQSADRRVVRRLGPHQS